MIDRHASYRQIVIAISASFVLFNVQVAAQTNSQETIQVLRFERPEETGTYITLEPPAVALTPYALYLPADTPRLGAGLYFTGTSPHSSEWQYHSGAVIELATSNGNLRRMGLSLAPSSVAAVPGSWSMDLQAFRSASNQTSAGQYSLVFSGSENTATGTYAIVAGGSQNTATAPQDVVVGGSNNRVSTFGNSNGRSGILGGADNYAQGYEVVLFGGRFNYLQASGNSVRSIIGGGELDSLTGGADSRGTLLGGFNNNVRSSDATLLGGSTGNVTGGNSAVLGGELNSVTGTGSAILGGLQSTLSGNYGFVFSAGPLGFSTATTGEFILNNVHVVFGGSGGGQSTLRFYEPKAGSPIGEIGTYNFVEIQGPAVTTDDLDNTYTLPVAIPTSGSNLLSIMDGATATSAALEWAAAPTRPTTTVNTVAPNVNPPGAFNIAAANLNESELLLVNSNNTPGQRRVTLANGLTDGFVVTLRVYDATANRGIRLVAGANLNMAGAGDVDLDQFDTITLVWDASSAAWLEISRSTN